MEYSTNPFLRIFMTEFIRIMNVKLTLSVDQEVIKKAKQVAKKKGRSLSRLVEDYLRYVSLNEPQIPKEHADRVKSLLGCIRVPDSFDYKKELEEAILKKHIHNDQGVC
jgi:hypothetical protein